MIRTRNVILAVVVGVVVLALGTGGVAGAATVLHATLSGKKEVPKAGNGTGSARLTLNTKTGKVCYSIKLKHVGTVGAGHIHKGGKTTAGGIVVELFRAATKKPKGCVKGKKSDVRDIVEHPGRYYVNVHNAKYPAGAARGQLH
jgi:CHRD domain